jgi:hypothetical protein
MKRIFALVLLVCFPLLYAHAQATAQISGTVLDASGAAIPGAQVQITNTDTNAVRTAQSGSDGSYSFPNLPIGPYKLEVSKSGFTTYVQAGIVLQVGVNPTVNATLQVGAVTQTVEVQANAAMVETQSQAGLGQVIQPEQVVDLPLNDRQATQLIALSGAAVSTAGAGGLQNNLEYPNAPTFSIAGSQANSTNYYLDGSLNMDYRTNIGEPMPFPDALQEFRVESSASPADIGIRPGGTVNAAVKSGTNSFHGDAFDYLRNTVLDAYPDRFATSTGAPPPASPDNLKRNQFGGTIGGPIVKNKLFFFYGYQGTRERVTGGFHSTRVPTQATLNGDFTAMLAPPCQKKTIFLNSAYTTAPNSNILLPSLLTTPSALITRKFVPYLPAPVDACGDASYQSNTDDDENQSVMRADWQRTQNDSIFLRYFITNYTLQPYFANNDILTASAPGLSDRVQTVDLGDTKIITPQLISSLRLAFLRTATVRTAPNGIPTWSQLGAQVTTQTANFTGQNSISGYASPNDPAYPGYDYENTFEISESIGWTHGAHQMTFGFQGEHIQMNNDGLFQVNANLSFTSNVTGDGLADFLTGNASSIRQGNGQLGRDSQNMPALFFQDYWKVKRTFQVNMGVRWDPFIPQYNKYKQVSDFSLASYEAGKISSTYPNAPPGVTFPGDYGFNEKSDTNPHIWDFAPRIGIVWDPRGNGRETIRAGYGVFYDTSVLWNTMHIVLNPPWGLTVSNPSVPTAFYVNGALDTSGTCAVGVAGCAWGGTVQNPWNGFTGGNPFPSPLNPPSSFVFPEHGTFVFENQGNKAANTQQWNLSFEKQLGANWLVSAAYLGSKGTHEWLGQNMNPSVVITPEMTSAQYPAIVANNVVAGSPDVGSCTLLYGAQQVTFNPCNGNGNSSNAVNGVTNNNARRLMNLINPALKAGPALDGGLLQEFANGNSAYNGLLLTAQHRLSQNFSISTNFTWSHCLDQGEIGQDIGNAYQNPFNRKADWGACSFDRRKIYNLSLVAMSPHHSERALQAILGDWQGSGIFTATSGSWLNLTDGEDESLTGVGADRPDEVGNPFKPGAVGANPSCVAPTAIHTLKAWFNPCAFAMAPLGSYGTLGRNAIQGPGNWNFDAAIWRTFPISERFKLDFRAEAFNAFNHMEIGNPATALFTGLLNNSNPPNGLANLSTSAGFISSSVSPTSQRIMQFALKLTF